MAEMKPGDVRVFKGGTALVVGVGIWAKREREHLRIDITGFGGHTTISNNRDSERYQPPPGRLASLGATSPMRLPSRYRLFSEFRSDCR